MLKPYEIKRVEVQDVHGNDVDLEAASWVADPVLWEDLAIRMGAGNLTTWQEFFNAYAEEYAEKHGEPFAPYEGLPW